MQVMAGASTFQQYKSRLLVGSAYFCCLLMIGLAVALSSVAGFSPVASLQHLASFAFPDQSQVTDLVSTAELVGISVTVLVLIAIFVLVGLLSYGLGRIDSQLWKRLASRWQTGFLAQSTAVVVAFIILAVAASVSGDAGALVLGGSFAVLASLLLSYNLTSQLK